MQAGQWTVERTGIRKPHKGAGQCELGLAPQFGSCAWRLALVQGPPNEIAGALLAPLCTKNTKSNAAKSVEAADVVVTFSAQKHHSGGGSLS
jgi:hypothetical protein